MFPFSLLSGSPLTKVLAGVIAVMALATGLLFWMYTNKAESAAKWEQAHGAVLEANLNWQADFEKEQLLRKREANIALDRERARQTAVNQNHILQQNIRELSHAQPEISTYLDLPIPDDLLGSLQQYAAANDGTGTGEDVSARKLVGTMPRPPDSRQPN